MNVWKGFLPSSIFMRCERSDKRRVSVTAHSHNHRPSPPQPWEWGRDGAVAVAVAAVRYKVVILLLLLLMHCLLCGYCDLLSCFRSILLN